MSKLVALIQSWEAFLEGNPAGSLQDFAATLLQSSGIDSKSAYGHTEDGVALNDPDFEIYGSDHKISMQGAYLIGRMNQYIAFYTKPMMKKYGLHSLDDFGYLQNIKFYTNITKTKACALMLHEITTGVDIIKRLIKNGFIEEKINKEDKREKLLAITPKANEVLELLYADFLKLPDTFGHLSISDKQALLNNLQVMDSFHKNEVKLLQQK